VDTAVVEAQNVDRAAYGIGRDRHSAGQRLDIHQPDVRPMGVERLDGVKYQFRSPAAWPMPQQKLRS
jgi:hypothetical protein